MVNFILKKIVVRMTLKLLKQKKKVDSKKEITFCELRSVEF